MSFSVYNTDCKMHNIYSRISELAGEKSSLVLATVISTKGSTPGKPGSSVLFGESGLLAGTIGGGFVENEVSKLATGPGFSAEPVIVEYELDKSVENHNEAICGGFVSVLIEKGVEKYNLLCREIELNISKRIPCVVATIVDRNADRMEVSRLVCTLNNLKCISDKAGEALTENVEKILGDPDSAGFRRIEDISTGRIIILEPILPDPRLIIAGAGHIGKALCYIASLLDFEVTVIDEREEYACPENLPEARHIIVKDIGTAVGEIKADEDTYIVIVTRGHYQDANALRSCIGGTARYIGMIGSKTKVNEMKADFLANGWATQAQWEKIHSPIGLEIGSVTVQEIAVSIAAELVKERSKKNPGRKTHK